MKTLRNLCGARASALSLWPCGPRTVMKRWLNPWRIQRGGPEMVEVEAAMGKLRPMPCLIWSVLLYGRVRVPLPEVAGERETVLDIFAQYALLRWSGEK